jgi:hypothetical protein
VVAETRRDFQGIAAHPHGFPSHDSLETKASAAMIGADQRLNTSEFYCAGTILTPA